MTADEIAELEVLLSTITGVEGSNKSPSSM
jgi:hypothetical protein